MMPPQQQVSAPAAYAAEQMYKHMITLAENDALRQRVGALMAEVEELKAAAAPPAPITGKSK